MPAADTRRFRPFARGIIELPKIGPTTLAFSVVDSSDVYASLGVVPMVCHNVGKNYCPYGTEMISRHFSSAQ